MNVATRIIVAEDVIIMNPISISHDVMVRREILEMTLDLGRRSTCTTKNLGVNIHIVLTMLSRIHFK